MWGLASRLPAFVEEGGRFLEVSVRLSDGRVVDGAVFVPGCGDGEVICPRGSPLR